MTVAEAARRSRTSQTSVAKWRDQFLESGKAGLTAGASKQASSREAMLEEQIEEQIEDLKAALGEAHVELRVWKKSAEGRLAPWRTLR